MNKHAITWFEIPVNNYSRAKKFYETVFNQSLSEMAVGNDVLAMLPFDQENDGIGGALIKADGYVPSGDGVRIYFPASEDMGLLLDRVEKAGGEVILGKTLISNEIGYYAMFQDTEGNRLAFHSTD
jgi:hypothetical protein